jgi:hypothetical protein
MDWLRTLDGFNAQLEMDQRLEMFSTAKLISSASLVCRQEAGKKAML